MEKLIWQIFEKKRWIIEQAKQQSDVYDQHLASKCLIEGIVPPPWLCTSYPPPNSTGSELNNEEIITGLLFPSSRPSNICSNSHQFLYQQPVVKADYVGTLNDPPARDHSPKRLCEDDWEQDLSNNIDVHASNVASRQDPSVTSPGDSKQPDRVTESASKTPCKQDLTCSSSGNCQEERVLKRASPACQPDPSITSPKNCEVDGALTGEAGSALSLARVQRSKARQRDLELRSSEKASKSRSHCKTDLGASVSRIAKLEIVDCGKMTLPEGSAQKSRSNSKHSDCIKSSSVESLSRSSYASPRFCQEKEIIMPITANKENFVVEEAGICDSQTQKGSETAYSGRITRSKSQAQESSSKSEGSSYGKSSSVKLQSRSSSASLRSGLDKELPQSIIGNEESFVVEETRLLDSQPQIKHGSSEADKITSTEASAQKISSRNEGLNSRTSLVPTQSRSSDASFKFEDEIENFQPNTINNAGFLVKEVKSGDVLHKEKGEIVYSDGISRSRSIVQAANSVNHALNGSRIIVQDSGGLHEEPVALQREIIVPSAGESCKVEAGPSSRTEDQAEPLQPVQLEFCENKEYNLDENLENEIHGKSPKNNLISPEKKTIIEEHGLLNEEEILGKSPPIDQAPLRVSPVNEPDWPSSICRKEELMAHEGTSALEKNRIINKEEKLDTSSSADQAELITGSSRFSDSERASTVKENAEVHLNVVTDSLQKNNNVNVANSLSNESTEVEVSCEESSNNVLMEAYTADISIISSEKDRMIPVKEDPSPIDALKPAKSVSKESSPGNNILPDDSMPIKADLSEVNLVPVNQMDVYMTDSDVGHSSPTLAKGLEEDLGRLKRKSGHSHDKEQKSSERSYIPNDRSLACSGLAENDFAKISTEASGSSPSTMGCSWLQNKRRKTLAESSNYMPAAPSSRDDALDPSYGKREDGIFHMWDTCSLEHYDVELQKMIGSGFSSELQLMEGCLLEETGNLDSAVFIDKQPKIDENQLIAYHENGPGEDMVCAEETSKLSNDGQYVHDLVDSSCRQSLNLISSDQNQPELERFIIHSDDKNPRVSRDQVDTERWEPMETTEVRASISEQICGSSCMRTPSLQPLNAYGFHENPNLHLALPNELEGMVLDSSSSLCMMDDDSDKLEDRSLLADFLIEHALPGTSNSVCLTSSGAESSSGDRNLCLSPIRKLLYTSMPTVTSEKRGSSSPYLPCIDEENENMDEAAEIYREGSCLELANSSLKTKADFDEPCLSHSTQGGKQSLESINTEFSFTATCNSVKSKCGKPNDGSRRWTGKGKQNQLLKSTAAKRNLGPLHNRPGKLALSENPSLRSQGPGMSEKEPKRNNIVSNITSFIPLVQPKQLPAQFTGKREVKVKALEKAEAVKRDAERKENERKIKKETMKLERARHEQENLRKQELEKKKKEEEKKRKGDEIQENLRKQELEKKKKEEEKKRKEDEMAVRKRQREEEEKKLKEAKRKRVGEVQKQQREPVAKSNANKEEKEIKTGAIDVKILARKENIGEVTNDGKSGQEQMGNKPNKVLEVKSETMKASKGNVSEDISTMVVSGDKSEVISDPTKEEAIFSIKKTRESYDISPYKDSDNEEEDDDDDRPNTKFIPAWACKNCIGRALSSRKNILPEQIFSLNSFSRISDVLVRRKPKPR